MKWQFLARLKVGRDLLKKVGVRAISSSRPRRKYGDSMQEVQVAEQQQRNRDAGQMTELVRDFLDPALFLEDVSQRGISFFCGVPDSLLKDFCAYVSENVEPANHIIAANEGSAVAIAAGYHLATRKNSLVYLQNSGLGNIVNPVLSLASPSVYRIPMLLLVGWRGEPGKRDEPQHRVQGGATPGLLASLGIPFQVLPDYREGAQQALLTADEHMKNSGSPYCLLVKRQTFLPYSLMEDPENGYEFPLDRESAMQVIVDNLMPRDVIVASTGMLSRELFEYRAEKEHGHERDFLTVGSMGHASSIAVGISKFRSKRQVVCLDGDGAAVMHMGAMATIGQQAPHNFKHIIFNNGAHDSVGGQPTVGGNHENFFFTKVAKGCGYKEAWTAITEEQIVASVEKLREIEGPALLEVKIMKGSRGDLGRPTRTPQQNKSDFMHFLAIE